MTNRRRYLISAAVLVACVCLAWVVVAMLQPPQPGVTQENYWRIKTGMTKAEVVGILGGEAHHKPNELPQEVGFTMATHIIQTKGHVWASKNCRIYVVFDDEWKVTGAMGPPLHYQLPETIPDKLRRWLRLPQ